MTKPLYDNRDRDQVGKEGQCRRVVYVPWGRRPRGGLSLPCPANYFRPALSMILGRVVSPAEVRDIAPILPLLPDRSSHVL